MSRCSSMSQHNFHSRARAHGTALQRKHHTLSTMKLQSSNLDDPSAIFGHTRGPSVCSWCARFTLLLYP